MRISVEELLRHPWVMKGYDSPVDWKSKIDVCKSKLCYYLCIGYMYMYM